MGFRMWSEATDGVVFFETDQIRERIRGEPVHLRGHDVESDECIVCGRIAAVWYDSREKWESHLMHCK